MKESYLKQFSEENNFYDAFQCSVKENINLDKIFNKLLDKIFMHNFMNEFQNSNNGLQINNKNSKNFCC